MGQTIFFIAVGMWVLLDIYVMLIHGRRQRNKYIEKKSKYLIIVMILLGMLVPPFLIPGTKEAFMEPFTTLRYGSVLFILIGITIRLIAIFQLKNNFSGNVAIQEKKVLHQHGLYTYIRHPSYLGEIFNFLGVAIAYNLLISSLFAFIIPSLAFIYRIKIEERVLISYFEKDYIDYQKKTKKIIPFIY
jgi:protein-S-isoprenylcysteine O-methyltransferase Ste14